jgi:hypothetical protein
MCFTGLTSLITQITLDPKFDGAKKDGKKVIEGKTVYYYTFTLFMFSVI